MQFPSITDLGRLGSVCLKYFGAPCHGYCPFIGVCEISNEHPKSSLIVKLYRGVTSCQLRAMADVIDELEGREGSV